MPAKRRTATRMTPGFTGPFKGAPQPGTLFDKRALDQLPGNVEATRNRPGPRGYSPARLAEVRGAFETARTTGSNANPVSHPIEVSGYDKMNETAHYYGPSSYNYPEPPHMGRARSRILDTLSRSTINVSDEMENPLAGLGRIRTEMQPVPDISGEYRSNTGVYEDKPNARGVRPPVPPSIHLYTERPSWGTRGNPNYNRNPRAEQTLLHELGHHDSWVAGTSHSEYETESQQAQEEAYADTFAVKHFRQDPRDKEPYDPRENTYMARGNFLGRTPDYERKLPASMHPPTKKNRNLGQQFEQQTLANPFFFGTAQRY